MQPSVTSPSDPSVFFFSPSLRWLLPPRYDPLTVLWLTNNHTDANVPATEAQAEIEWIAEILFKSLNKETYNDPEFLQVLQEWYKENEEHRTDQQTDCEPSSKRKRLSYF